MRGLGYLDLREAVWAKQYWKPADEQAGQKLQFEDFVKLCKRLNVNSSREDLSRRFEARSPLLFSFVLADRLRSKLMYKSADFLISTTSSASLSC